MELPSELTRIPASALDVLRYMGEHNIETAEANQLAEGTGKSSTATGKAIRGLVTKGYMNMGADRVYFLTEKGMSAIEDLKAYDAEKAANQSEAVQDTGIECELVIVTPHPIATHNTTSLQIGLSNLTALSDETMLILRFSATAGTVSPAEVTFELQANAAPEPMETFFTPTGQLGTVRFRVEAIQMVTMTSVHPAGAMFFDVPLDQANGTLQAWYTDLQLQKP